MELKQSGKRRLVQVVIALWALMGVLSILKPGVCYADEQALAIKVGVPDIAVDVTFGAESLRTEHLVTNQEGIVLLEPVSTYCAETLAWDQEEMEPEVKELELAYDINYADVHASKKSTQPHGNDKYKGSKGTITLSYQEQEGTTYWKHELSLLLEKETFVKGSVVRKNQDGSQQVLSNTEVTIQGKTVQTDQHGTFDFYPQLTEADAQVSEVFVEGTDEYQEYQMPYQRFVAAGHVIQVKQRAAAAAHEQYEYGPSISQNGYVKAPGTYQIVGKNGCTLSNSRLGDYQASLDVKLNDKGEVQTVYVKGADGVVFLPVETILRLDTAQPVIQKINAVKETSGTDLNFFPFGIFTKFFADLTLDITITDEGSGVDHVYLIGKQKKDGTIEKMKASKMSKTGDTVAVEFVLSAAENLYLERELSVVAVDRVGNESTLQYIRSSASASTLGIENEKPAIGSIAIMEAPSSFGWYNKECEIQFTAQDPKSGLNSVSMTVNGNACLTKTYQKQEKESKSFSYRLTKKQIEKWINEDGSYQIVLQAMDNAGNVQTKKKTIYVDLVSPNLTLSGIEKSKHYQSTPTLMIQSDEKHYAKTGAAIQVQVYRDGKKVQTKEFTKVNQAAVSSFSKDGDYEVVVTSCDAAGNKAKPKTIAFTKDATAPVLEMTGAQEKQYYKMAKTIEVRVKEHNYKKNQVMIHVLRTLDGKKAETPVAWKNEGEVSTCKIPLSSTGTYHITAEAKDEAGNVAKPQTLTFTVDTEKPKIEIKQVTSKKAYGYRDVVAPKVIFQDSYLKDQQVQISKADGKTRSLSRTVHQSKTGGTITYNNFQKKASYDGIYTVTATATDRAGNKERKQVSFSVNRFGSTFSYNKAIKSVQDAYLKNLEENLVIREYNVAALKKSRDDIKLDGRSVAIKGKITKEPDKDRDKNVYVHTYEKNAFDQEGMYTINVISEDVTGNKAESKEKAGSIQFAIDKTPPMITVNGLTENIHNAKQVKADVSLVDNLSPCQLQVKLDGKTIHQKSFSGIEGTIEVTIPEGLNHSLEVTATDQAGNVEHYKKRSITVSTNRFVRLLANKAVFYSLLAGVILGLAVLSVIVYKIRKTFISKKKESGEDHVETK